MTYSVSVHSHGGGGYEILGVFRKSVDIETPPLCFLESRFLWGGV